MIEKLSIDNVFANNNEGIGGVHHPYIIAEAGVNHEGSLDLAMRLINEAAEGGAHAIKFQTYKAHTIAARESPSYWDTSKEPTKSQFELFKKYDRFWKNEYEELKHECDKVDIEFMSTPFDIESAKFLNDLMPVFKISSSDITNLPFIQYLCAFNKPILLSTGASYADEINRAAGIIETAGNKLCLLHCILNYPTADENANLAQITSLIKAYPNHIIGYSDHTLPGDMKTLEIASLLGAKILEKHFTHDKTLPGNDHYHAMDKDDLKRLNENLDRIFSLLGSEEITALPTEEPARSNARRSLVALNNIKEGQTVQHSDLTWKRPASGISPAEIDQVIGKKAARNIIEDEILKWEMLE